MRKENRHGRSSTVYSAMDNRPVGFIDSGIGGLHYLESTKRVLPNEQLVYLADNAHFPYGNKSHDAIRNIVTDAVKKLTDAVNPKVVVVACNTASVVALSHLRERFSVPFIGVVPAVKPAAEQSRGRRIGVLATSRTVEDTYTAALINDFASDCIVTRNHGSGLVDFIENRLCSADAGEIKKQVSAALNDFHQNGIDTLVLGCTHFMFLEEYFQEFLGPNVELIDSRQGVSNRVAAVLQENGMFGNGGKKDLLYISGRDTQRKYQSIAEQFNLLFYGVL